MIIGKRVRLRAMEPTDLKRCLRWINDPEVTEHLTMREPISSVSETRWLEKAAARDDPRAPVRD